MITRQATPADAAAMCAIINPLIEKGDSTANRTLYDETRMIEHCISHPFMLSCVLAQDGDEIFGFQYLRQVEPGQESPDALPEDWGVIASFVGPNAQGKGIGRLLFNATLEQAKAANLVAIDATIRADNVLGLAFYSKMGFVDYHVKKNVPLEGHGPVDRICKRYDV